MMNNNSIILIIIAREIITITNKWSMKESLTNSTKIIGREHRLFSEFGCYIIPFNQPINFKSTINNFIYILISLS
jgi:hypothetical protein